MVFYLATTLKITPRIFFKTWKVIQRVQLLNDIAGSLNIADKLSQVRANVEPVYDADRKCSLGISYDSQVATRLIVGNKL
jgi:hypothetical protein